MEGSATSLRSGSVPLSRGGYGAFGAMKPQT